MGWKTCADAAAWADEEQTPRTVPDPATADPDHLEHLADEITTLSAHIHAATHRLLTLIAGPTPSASVPRPAPGVGARRSSQLCALAGVPHRD